MPHEGPKLTKSAHFKSIHQVTALVLLSVQTRFHGSVVERRSLTGEISLSCAQPTADR